MKTLAFTLLLAISISAFADDSFDRVNGGLKLFTQSFKVENVSIEQPLLLREDGSICKIYVSAVSQKRVHGERLVSLDMKCMAAKELEEKLQQK